MKKNQYTRSQKKSQKSMIRPFARTVRTRNAER